MTAVPSACSGDINAGVPRITPSTVFIWSMSSAYLANPKSVTRNWPGIPDVSVTDGSVSASEYGYDLHADDQSVAVAGTALVLPRVAEPRTQRYVQIVDSQSGNRLVTSIEFLSPGNKTGEGRNAFRKKQDLLIDGDVNVVEIDLVRAGEWSISVPIQYVPPKHRGLYRAVVVRATEALDCEYYPIPIYAPLPTLKIPLRPTDDDVALELQPLLKMAYQNGAYAETLDYLGEPQKALPDDVREWTMRLVKKQG